METTAQEIARDQEADSQHFSIWTSWLCVVVVIIIIALGIDHWIMEWFHRRINGKTR